MKNIVLGALLAVGIAAGAAYGHGNGYFNKGGGHMNGGNHMMGPGYQMMHDGGAGSGYGDCPGRGGYRTNSGTMHNQEFLDATVSLRKQMHDKNFELREATRNPQTTQAQIAELQKEIIDLRSKIHEQAEKYSGSVQ